MAEVETIMLKVEKPKISIIIRTYNEGKNIENCLKAVFDQKTNSPFEVIIVDSGSADKTLDIAEKYNIGIIKIQNFTVGKALNKGIEKAKGEYCVLLSADATPLNENWTENLIKSLENKNIAGVFGKEIPYNNCNPCEKRKIIGTFDHPPERMFTSSNAAIKKGLWLKNKYDENIVIAEDWLWAKRIKSKGYKILYSKNAVVRHSHDANFSRLFKRTKSEIYEISKMSNARPISLFLKVTMRFFYSVFYNLKYTKFNVLQLPHILAYELVVLTASFSSGLRLFRERLFKK